MDTHDCDGHDPGTRACYVSHRCRCEQCTEANRLYYHQWNRERLERKHGARESKYVPADQPRRTLARIREQGIGLRSIQKRTGLARSSMYRLARGERDRVLKSTARALAGLLQETITE